MSDVQRYGDLEIVRDPRLQERIWSWQRAAWAGIGVILTAALVGFFGDGPISRTTVRDPDGLLQVGYERFGRCLSAMTLEVRLRPMPGGVVRLWVGRDYLEGAGIERVTPTPGKEIADADGTTFLLSTAPADRDVRVAVHLNPARPGLLRARLRREDGPSVEFVQLIYP
jgi:hypothetical protein